MAPSQRRTQRRDGAGNRGSFDCFPNFFRSLGGSFGDDWRGRWSSLPFDRRRLFCVRYFRSLSFWRRGSEPGSFHCRFASQAAPHQKRLIVLKRAGMRLFLKDAELWKHLNDGVGLDFQFPGQLVDADFTHRLRL